MTIFYDFIIIFIKRGIITLIKPKGGFALKITFNEDEKIVNMIRNGLKKKDGYCPCRLEKTEDNICMCKEFRDQIADPNFEGYCHCRLYYKSLND